MIYTVERGYYKLGATVDKEGVNFGIFSKNGEKVVLNIFHNAQDIIPSYSCELDSKKNRTGDIWHIFVKGIKKNMFYTWNIYGPRDDIKGNKFNFGIHLIDPYAKGITEKKECIFQKAVILDESIFYREIKRPETAIEKSIIYELHVGLYTKSPSSKVKYPGTYKGLIEKIPYLKSLGITGVELLPIHEFDDYIPRVNPVTGEVLRNVWGYNSIGFFAPTIKYYSGEKSKNDSYEKNLTEFIELVDAFHEAGIEVILDVVYNHTAEGNEEGEILNFKGMDNSIFYHLTENKKSYKNYSGCGNTLNCNHPVVKEMIIDSLRYWYSVVGVDGFRFDLGGVLGRGRDGKWLENHNFLLYDIAKDMVLSKAKLFGEAWDTEGYFLDKFPSKILVWNDKYRDGVRKFIKGDNGVVQDFINRVIGSPDIFKNRKHIATLNYITAHDGFTMWDLLSYNQKNNIENGEESRDGNNNENSWNHGIEGETLNKEILTLRKRQIKNLLGIQLLSRGVPMLLMGDELGRTQKGNNNPYCHDSELTWVDWKRAEDFKEITEFLKGAINFRKNYQHMSIKDYKENRSHISYHGVEPGSPDMGIYSHSIAFMLSYGESEEKYVALNFYHEELEFRLPTVQGKDWYLVMSTGIEGDNSWLTEPIKIEENKIKLIDRSIILAVAR